MIQEMLKEHVAAIARANRHTAAAITERANAQEGLVVAMDNMNATIRSDGKCIDLCTYSAGPGIIRTEDIPELIGLLQSLVEDDTTVRKDKLLAEAVTVLNLSNRTIDEHQTNKCRNCCRSLRKKCNKDCLVWEHVTLIDAIEEVLT